MDAYFLEVRKLENKFYGLEFHHVVRDNNVAADVLSKLGSIRAQVPEGVFVHKLHAPSIPELAPPITVPAHPPAGQEVMMIDVDWRQPFIDYLSERFPQTRTWPSSSSAAPSPMSSSETRSTSGAHLQEYS
jgi:hypothetical protein